MKKAWKKGLRITKSNLSLREIKIFYFGNLWNNQQSWIDSKGLKIGLRNSKIWMFK